MKSQKFCSLLPLLILSLGAASPIAHASTSAASRMKTLFVNGELEKTSELSALGHAYVATAHFRQLFKKITGEVSRTPGMGELGYLVTVLKGDETAKSSDDPILSRLLARLENKETLAAANAAPKAVLDFLLRQETRDARLSLAEKTLQAELRKSALYQTFTQDPTLNREARDILDQSGNAGLAERIQAKLTALRKAIANSEIPRIETFYATLALGQRDLLDSIELIYAATQSAARLDGNPAKTKPTLGAAQARTRLTTWLDTATQLAGMIEKETFISLKDSQSEFNWKLAMEGITVARMALLEIETGSPSMLRQATATLYESINDDEFLE